MGLYINRKGDGYLETVSEYPKTREGRAEALKDLIEYRLADPTAYHYLSQRACKDWREAKQ